MIAAAAAASSSASVAPAADSDDAISCRPRDERPLRDLSPIVRGVLPKHRVPGLLGALVDLEGCVGLGVGGVRKAGVPSVPLCNEDTVHIGSDAKAMTATLVAQLVAAGSLHYDATMATLFPSLAPRMQPVFAKITVAHLLTHRAGLPPNVDWWRFERGGARTDSVMVKRLRIAESVLCGVAAPPFPPGSSKLYSNVGYVLLGVIIEQQMGCSWETAISQRLFAPLGMRSAGFGPPPVVWGHTGRGEEGAPYEPMQHDNAPPMGPAGRVHLNMRDWSRYIAWTLRVYREDTPLLPRKEQQRILSLTLGGDYAAGWVLTERAWASSGFLQANGPVLTHSGSNTMWMAVAWLAPAKGFAVLAVANAAGEGARTACDQLASAMIRAR
jgi:CubicO group peptidase (beta-lactamase class C family)